jgi:hypothetical protein
MLNSRNKNKNNNKIKNIFFTVKNKNKKINNKQTKRKRKCTLHPLAIISAPAYSSSNRELQAYQPQTSLLLPNI